MLLKLLPVIFLITSQIGADCPTSCACELDTRGRRVVQCKEGGIVDFHELQNLTLDTEVLKISAPEDNNNILTMSPVLQDYVNLEELHITRSNIPQLGEHFFYTLTKLEVLNLSHNNISQPLSRNFLGLTNLKALYLDDNRIHSLTSNVFRYLPKLKTLSIQRNRLKELAPRLLGDVTKLEVLKISENYLKILNPEVFEDVKDLKVLECRACGLDSINAKLTNILPELTTLDLSENKLKYIAPDELKGLRNLKHLKLTGNQFTAIKDKTFVNQPQLQVLNLGHNNIERISPYAFVNLNNITYLNLGYNKLETFDSRTFTPIKDTLKTLILSGNPLKLDEISGVLDTLKVETLHLVNCNIFEIHIPVFPDSLRLLNLAENHLSALDPRVIPNVKELDISRNRFRGLDEVALNKLDFVEILKLDNNPWSCDWCHIGPLLDRVNRSSVSQSIVCAYPYTAKGRRLSQIDRSELGWCTGPSYSSADANFFSIADGTNIRLVVAGMSVCLLVLIVLAIFAALLYSKRHEAKYYTHEEKLGVGKELFEPTSPLFPDELSFKFPYGAASDEKKASICTIEDMRDQKLINGL